MNDLTQHTDRAARELIFRQADLMARWTLIDLAQKCIEKNWVPGVVGSLLRAEYYLSDRKRYESNPPPKGTLLVLDTERAGW